MVYSKGTVALSDDYIITTQCAGEETTESLGHIMFRCMKTHQEKIAQIDAKTGQKDTFGDLLQRCIRTALHMSEKKITRDDIIALCSKNHLDSVVPYIATQFLGAKAASIDPSLSSQEMVHLLNTVRPRMIFASSESVPVIEKFLQDLSLNSDIVVFGATNKHTEFADFLKPQPNEEDFEPVEIEDLKDTAVVHFSSGTTGLPKGICISHFSFIGQSLNSMHTENPDFEYMKTQAERVSFPLTQLCYTSLYWVSAGVMLLASIIQAHCRLVCQDFDGEEIWRLIQKYKPVVVVLTPVQAMEMVANRTPSVDVRSILSIIIVGSPISKEYLLKVRQIFPEADVTQGYGQTETCGALTTFKGNDVFHRSLMTQETKIGSVGLPVPGASYKVVDLDSNKNLGPNQRGELRIKSKFVMNGYYNQNSSDAFDEDGWLKTGDIVYYDEDYCFYVVDRIREAFKYRGWFIAPAILESELLSHPSVKQAVVVGIPQEDGYHPMGLVVVRKGSRVTEDEIEKFVEERVPERQRLRGGVKFINYVPLTVTGKVKRKELQQMILQERYHA